MRGRSLLTALGVAALLAAGVALMRHAADPVRVIPGVAGPAPSTPLPIAPPATTPAGMTQGTPSRMALLLTQPDSAWLSLAFALRTIGIPFLVTTDVATAVRHRVVVAYPTISGRTVTDSDARELREHVARGGTLLAFEVLGGALQDVFGLQAVQPDARRLLLRFTTEAKTLWGFDAPEEGELPLGNAKSPWRGEALTVREGAQVMAAFEDGSPALVRQPHGSGQAWLLALDLGAFVGAAQQGRLEIWRDYVNAYEPTVDVLLRWLKAVYRAGEPMAVTLGTVPEGRPLAVVLSHDVDYSGSMRNALVYARSEAAQRVRATYFVQTKYVRDWNDQRFFDTDGLALTRELARLGGELASHSVSHSPVFARLAPGTGREAYPSYVPVVESRQVTRDATLLGELRVSRFLLQQAKEGADITAFRPGHLQYPFVLPEALNATGYRYSSSLTAGAALSHLPFQLSHSREGRTAVPVHEFPITLEDERVRPMDAVLLPRALAVADRLARYGGSCVLLIHPNVLDDKLRFQEAFVSAMQSRGAWIGPLGAYADWWAARDRVGVDVQAEGRQLRITVAAPVAIGALPLQLPRGYRLAGAAPGPEVLVRDYPAGRTELLLEAGP